MPRAIPENLTREHVLLALAELDAGAEHPFGEPTVYELVHDGRRYPPKAAIGLAFRHSAGHFLRPDEFSGGEAHGQANSALRRLGFDVVRRTPGVGVVAEAIVQERERRRGMWSSLSEAGGPLRVAPSILRELGIFGGAQGIWVNKVVTGSVGPARDGVTVGLLHTGRSYADDLAENCIIYHYPSTRRGDGRDRAEVEATKAAGRLGLPVFVISYPSPNAATRDVRLGRIEAWDDECGSFLVSFEEQPAAIITTTEADSIPEGPFQLIDDASRKTRVVPAREGQQRFKFRVLQRYGPKCVVCGFDVVELLDAAHLRPKKANGSDDPRNGIVLCATHHRAFDLGHFAIEPTTFCIKFRETGPDAARLGVPNHSLEHLEKKPHPEAISWAWDHWRS
ncbi:HNH endonuclease signature motif containing protein [Isosphaeraceae bacterium EP7]